MRVTHSGGSAGSRWRPDQTRRLRWLVIPPLLALLTGGCVPRRARVEPESPPPPDRATPAVVLAEPRAEPEVVPPPTADGPASSRPVPTRPTPGTAPSDPQPEETAAPDAVPHPVLSAPGDGLDATEVAVLLTRVATLLDRVDRPRLSPADQVQYDTARRFVDQATTASGAGNVLFARQLGKKAEALAHWLAR